MNIKSVYAPQSGRTIEEKDEFFAKLMNEIVKVPDSEILVVAGDLNGHVGKHTDGFDNIHGGNGFGDRNSDGTRILDMCTATNLAITNTFFKNSDSKLVTYKSGTSCTQIDYYTYLLNEKI